MAVPASTGGSRERCCVERCDRPGTGFSCPRCKNRYCFRHGGDDRFQCRIDREGRFQSGSELKRVCEYCYWERPGYGDAESPRVDHMGAFEELRRRLVEVAELDAHRLERRLQKLAEYCTDSSKQVVSFKEYCQRLIPWASDSTAESCTCCHEPFSAIANRRHHCRLCGRLLCASCSSIIPITPRDSASGKVRCCPKCHGLLFRYGSSASELTL